MEEIYTIIDTKDHDAWLKARTFGIGGSDAAAVLGLNPYKTNTELYEEKTGQWTPEDISDKPYVKYGTMAEPLIRELFSLDYPEYKVEYHENRILRSNKYPFMQASLDGELTDQDGRRGILEIKTSNIRNGRMFDKWKERIPDNYYIQVLHYLLVTGYQFVVLRAHLRTDWGGAGRQTSVRHYFIERSEVTDDLDMLLEVEQRFWNCVESGRKPPLILPEI
ncbi:YqaJ viral recombinase family protein [Blautia liquoris]|jgi:putative phage-type endonuclease|uniref:YqaJ viral recombinase family protein n=1 Tax=Blautia liquoris TaxID=2779518 RepID=A0A7M2RMI3_9FIRM|nr:YqaJ viral recombinase family protein [Blautia liquoris]QOV20550.1 YqaJ viral recombinase family protein [Blautia liquoris]